MKIGRYILLYAMGTGALLSCQGPSLEGWIVAVQEGLETDQAGSQLIAFDPSDPEADPLFLTESFYSACSPVVSPAARYLVFSGKKEAEDPWQIWIRDLRRKRFSRVTTLEEDCTVPLFLPDGKILFSKAGRVREQPVAQLFKCNRDGSALEQLTFHPHFDKPSAVLSDGRILFNSAPRWPAPSPARMMAMLPDGTKCQLYAGTGEDGYPVGMASEAPGGRIYFVETTGQGTGRLATIQRNRPLHSLTPVTEDASLSFRSVTILGDGSFLVSCRLTPNQPFMLCRFDPETGNVSDPVLKDARNLLDPVQVKPFKRPRILPSAVNPDMPTGLLLSQDVNHSVLPATEPPSGDLQTVAIRFTGVDKPLGEVRVSGDGSFYVKVDANLPFRMESLNSRGETIRGPSGWMWIRPNERRGCVGCHADAELAPENRVPLAVKQDPVEIGLKRELNQQESLAP